MSATVGGTPPVLTRLEAALDALRAGQPVLVCDDAGRENEGDAILAAATATAEWVGWMVRHTSGYLCAPMTGARADHLGLPLMVEDNQDSLRTAYTITCDAREGVTTGISAADRCRTAQVLADPGATAADLVRPGHMVPLRAREGGVLARPGHTEAAVDLCRLAGLEPVGIIGELVHDDGSMLRGPEVEAFAAEHDLVTLTVAELVQARGQYGVGRVVRGATAALPTRHGELTITAYRDTLTGAEHLAMVSARGLAAIDGGPTLVRLHSECLTGDSLGSLRCDCGPQLDTALRTVADQGGVVVLLRGQEGRGVGLANKVAAYHQQDQGADTVDAQTELGLPVDAREYGAGLAILADLGIGPGTHVRLMSNNPDKVAALETGGLVVTRREHWLPPTPDNARYLLTKQERMGHVAPSTSDVTSTGTITPSGTPVGLTDEEIA